MQLLLRGRNHLKAAIALLVNKPNPLRHFHAVEFRYLPRNTANIHLLGWRDFKNTIKLEPRKYGLFTNK